MIYNTRAVTTVAIIKTKSKARSLEGDSINILIASVLAATFTKLAGRTALIGERASSIFIIVGVLGLDFGEAFDFVGVADILDLRTIFEWFRKNFL
jgi:hypothetical protein